MALVSDICGLAVDRKRGVISGRFLGGHPYEKWKGRGTQDRLLRMTGAEKYAKVCREGAVLGTGSTPKFQNTEFLRKAIRITCPSEK